MSCPWPKAETPQNSPRRGKSSDPTALAFRFPTRGLLWGVKDEAIDLTSGSSLSPFGVPCAWDDIGQEGLTYLHPHTQGPARRSSATYYSPRRAGFDTSIDLPPSSMLLATASLSSSPCLRRRALVVVLRCTGYTTSSRSIHLCSRRGGASSSSSSSSSSSACLSLLWEPTRTTPSSSRQQQQQPWAGHHRTFASSSSSSSETQQEDEGVLLYTGGHADVIRTLKRVSLTTCVIGLFSTPFFLTLGSEAVPMAANVALTGIVLLATCGPTILLHAFTKPYIFALRILPPPPSSSEPGKGKEKEDVYFSADTIDFTSRRKTTTFRLSDVKPLPQSTRPFVSFSACDRLYFVHGETFPDKALLVKLLGRPLKPTEVEGGGGGR